MNTKRIAAVIGSVVLAVAMAGCSANGGGDDAPPGESPSSGAPDNGVSTPDGGVTDVSILMNWFAQAEQGGYWAMNAEGIAEEHGLNVTIKQGGPGIQTNPQIAAGKADFGIGNADEMIQASAEGLPLVAVAASFDHTLQGLLYHDDSGISDFADLKGHTVSHMPLPYWDYIASKYDLEGNVHSVNLQSLSSFEDDDDLVLQCYTTSEPFALEEAGVSDFGVLTSKDAGYDPYQNVLYTTQDYIDQHPDVVQAVVDAAVEGWQAMLDDPTKTEQAIMKANPDGDEYVLKKALAKMQDDSDLFAPELGTFSDERWETLRDQLASVGIVPEDFDVSKAYTNQFTEQ